MLAKNAAFRAAVEQLSPVPADLHDVPAGVTPVFSPRRTTAVLEAYAVLLDTAAREGCITFAFGVGAAFKDLLKDNTAQNAIVFMLLEKQDKPDPKHPTAFVRINATQQRLPGLGLLPREPGLPVGEGDERRAARAQPATSATCTRSSC